MAAGICSMGVDVLQVGPMPTPGMAFLTADMRCDAGVMISASHNGYQDNGIKFFSRDGFKLPDEIELRMEQLIQSGALARHRADARRDRIGAQNRRRDGALRRLPQEELPARALAGRGARSCSIARTARPTRWARS